jgi:hypothetical protein
MNDDDIAEMGALRSSTADKLREVDAAAKLATLEVKMRAATSAVMPDMWVAAVLDATGDYRDE